MNLALTSEQQQLRDTAARLFKAECTADRVIAAETGGFDRALWAKLTELGIAQMRSAGMSLLDAVIVAEEAGRCAAPVPLPEVIAAGRLLGETDAIATLALRTVDECPVQLVAGGSIAALVVALDGEELVEIQVEGSERALDIAASGAALLDLRAGTRTCLLTGPAAVAAFQAALVEWQLLNAAFQVGAALRAIDDAAAYSCERVQFGQPIGVFQALAHPLADAVTAAESAQLLVHHAIWAIETGRDDAAALAAMAAWWAGEAGDGAIRDALRALGGMGVAMDGFMQLLYRRAKFQRLVAGDPADRLDEIAARLWDGVRPALPATSATGLDFSYGDEAEAFAAELRAFVLARITPEIAATSDHTTESHDPAFHKAMAEAGYAFPSFSTPGQVKRDRYAVAAAAPLWEDIGWSRTAISITEFNAHMCQLWATDAAKAEILPRFTKGEALGCLGFSEPGAGSDVFACSFSARLESDGDWIMNGQKLWTTNAHIADYILMLTRTDTSGKKHQGLTMFLMPLNVAGVEIRAIKALNGERVNACFWSDVRIADKYRLGEVGDGARVMVSALGFEQGGAGYWAVHKAMLKHAIAWAERSGMIARRDVRQALARVAVHEKAADMLCRREIWADVAGLGNAAHGPMAKLFTTEWLERDAAAIVEIAAPQSLIKGSDSDLDCMELYMRRGLASTIHGGTSEVHRSLIAERRLAMPKSRG